MFTNKNRGKNLIKFQAADPDPTHARSRTPPSAVTAAAVTFLPAGAGSVVCRRIADRSHEDSGVMSERDAPGFQCTRRRGPSKEGESRAVPAHACAVTVPGVPRRMTVRPRGGTSSPVGWTAGLSSWWLSLR